MRASRVFKIICLQARLTHFDNSMRPFNGIDEDYRIIITEFDIVRFMRHRKKAI